MQIYYMPNKTIYVREADLPLWQAAQTQFGESISVLFAKFLRERLPMMDAFVHVLHSTHPNPANESEFVVMFAPIDQTGSGGAMKPHYVRGSSQLIGFLTQVGLTNNDAAQIASDLKRELSVSLRTTLTRSAVKSDCYRLRFRPTLVRSGDGTQNLLKVDATGFSTSRSQKQWHATFHALDDLLAALEKCLGLPAPQLQAIRQSLLSGQETELGGVTGAQYAISEERLIDLGMVESGPA